LLKQCENTGLNPENISSGDGMRELIRHYALKPGFEILSARWVLPSPSRNLSLEAG
jgi:hypothetical protein